MIAQYHIRIAEQKVYKMCDFAVRDLILLKKKLHVAPKASFSSPNPTSSVKQTTARVKLTNSDSSQPTSLCSSVCAADTSSSVPLPWYLMTTEQIYEREQKLQRKEQRDKAKATKFASSAEQGKNSPIQRSSVSDRRASTMAKLKEHHLSAPILSPRKLSRSSTSSSTVLTPKELSTRKLRSKDMRQHLQNLDTELASLASSTEEVRHQLHLNYSLLVLQQQELTLTKEKLSSIYDAAIAYLSNSSTSSGATDSSRDIDVSIFTLSKRHHSKRHKHYSATNATTTTKQMLRADDILKRHERFEYLWSVVRTFIRAIGRAKLLEKRRVDRGGNS